MYLLVNVAGSSYVDTLGRYTSAELVKLLGDKTIQNVCDKVIHWIRKHLINKPPCREDKKKRQNRK